MNIIQNEEGIRRREISAIFSDLYTNMISVMFNKLVNSIDNMFDISVQ